MRQSGALGESGRLLELFDFLAARGADTPSASQGEIAEAVFGQAETSVDDATVRVYVHRLRKRLEEFYAAHGEGAHGTRLTLPAGTYALRLAREAPEPARVKSAAPRGRIGTLALVVGAALALAATFLLGRALPGPGQAPPANALWQPFLDSPRPKLVVVGDYYMFGEIDPVRPEEGRLIRDFRVNSPSDLIQMQDLEPGRYGAAEDVGLNYLPFSAAYGLQQVVPILARDGREVRVVAASELEPDMLNRFDVVYVGLLSGMALLEDMTFRPSGFALGESYDELRDAASGRTFTSEEARNLASPVYYKDYGYVARFRTPGGALVAIVAGMRDTGLRGIAPIAAQATLPGSLADAAGEGDFEALYQITGQQGADLSERLLIARQRGRAQEGG
ncbi:MAG TPA: helix-turn-helix domain-containing protein [Croceibacterium sp.]|nr:helix-turn-helix domain-containing protein [Croceibacterium sp.]